MQTRRAGAPGDRAGNDPGHRDRDDAGIAVPAEFDARLAVGAGVAWLATFVCLHLPPAMAVPAAVFAGTVAVAALAADRLIRSADRLVRSSDGGYEDTGAPALVGRGRRRRWRSCAAGVALAGFCCFGTLMSLGAQLAQIRSGPIRALVQRSAAGVFEVTVSGDPRPIVSTQSFGADRVALDATLTRLRSGPQRYRVRVPVVILAPSDTWSAVIPGERLRLDGRLRAPQPDQFVGADISARGPPVAIGRAPWWQRGAARVRSDLRSAAAVLPAAERGLLPGLVDGDTSTLDPQLNQAFKTAGLTHLVAVSGTNLAVIIGAVLLVLRRLRTPPWACAVIGGVILVAFIAVARASPSVVRAGVMAGVLLVALATGRPRQGLPSLALAVLVLLIWHPEWAGNAGFAMSALATGSLFLIAPGWAEALRRRHVPPVLAEGLAVSGAATVVSAPIIVLLSGRVSLVALPANVLAEFAVAPATVLGVLAAATAPWSPFLGAAFARAAGVPCRWLVADARWFASLPGATVSWPGTAWGALGLVLVVAVAAVLFRFPGTRGPLVAALLTAVVIEVPGRAVFGGWAPGSTILVACDVGQGDGIVLPVGHHAAVVMDSGPEPLAIDRCLHSLGVKSVPLYIQSHFDLDHVGGVAGVADGRRIGRVLTGPLQEPSLGRGILTRTLTPLRLTSRIVPAGTDIDVGPLHLHVLESHIVDVDGAPDSNNSSLMIRATVAGHTILLTGDASTEAQQALIASGQNFTADVLKVPHHGSAYFDPTFLAAVHARLAVISVGRHNTYGHPAPSLLRALTDLHVPIRRTDLDGDVGVLARGSQLQVVRHVPSARLSAASGAPGRPRPVGPGGSAAARVVAAVEASAGHATMDRWRATQQAGSRLIGRPPTRPRPTGSFWSSVTRSSWSTAPSSRSPPPGVARTRTRNWSSGSAPRSSPGSCSSC